MFRKITVWFEQTLKLETSLDEQHTVELATAALLYEIMRADEELLDSEQSLMEQLLAKQFQLSDVELKQLIALSSQAVDSAAGFYQFTKVINDNCNGPEKNSVIENLWAIAYADNKIDPFEEHLIRKIADLLYIPHSEFIRTKLKVQGALSLQS